MTYLLTGTLVVQEKPEKYMEKYVHFKESRSKKVEGNRTEKEVRKEAFATTSKTIVELLNRRGFNFVYNDDIETAKSICNVGEKTVRNSYLFAPKPEWGDYLTKNFSETPEDKTLEGELRVWNELRLPSPWVYIFATGKLLGRYVFNGVGFAEEEGEERTGKRRTHGLIIDTPVLCLGINKIHTEEEVSVTRYY
jgi:hypothetical protein